MHIKSPFPPIPPLPHRNFHSVLFHQPPGNAIPTDLMLYVDPTAGQSSTVGQFIESVRDGATALAAPETVGGLGVYSISDLSDAIGAQTQTRARPTPASRQTDIIAILSPNCLVSQLGLWPKLDQ